MALGDLFKSQKERERETAVRRRKAFREAERAVDTVKDKIADKRKERDKAWAQARQYLKDGQKAAAQRMVMTCRACEVFMTKLEQKYWVFEQLLSNLTLAQSDQVFVGALQAINTVVAIDPEAVANVLDEVQAKLGEQVDTDRIWEKMYGRQMNGLEGQMEDVIPSEADMMRQLQDEVAVEIGGGIKAADKPSDGVRDKIGQGQRRLREMLGGDK